jgi:DNA-binding NarL/FixJ family response regulator
VVIHQRAFFRDCFVRCLATASPDQTIAAFAGFAEWRSATAPNAPPPAVLVVFLDSSRPGASQLTFLNAAASIPIVVVSDIDEEAFVTRIMARGVRGYVPTSLPLAVAVEAVRRVAAGGRFVPPRAAGREPRRHPPATQPSGLTARQIKVAEALCQGMANKQIAYALHLSEHTVKIHLRNIMRKFNVHNRTEVAIRANAMLNGHDLRSASP